MKKFNLILVLLACLIINQSFSQKSKPDINPDQEIKTKSIKDNGSKDYCLSTYPNQTDDWITNVTFNTINNSSDQDGANSYGNYDTISTGLLAGNTYTLSVSFFSDGYTEHVWVWFDWNGDDDFIDTGEAYDLGDGINTTLTTGITVPVTASVGYTRMRIIEQYSIDPDPCDPHGINYGETEDYSIYVFSNPYCSASGGCDEYIYQVHLGNHTVVTGGCIGYMDLSDFKLYDIPINTSENLSITIGNPYSSDQCGVWVDWNNDDDFYDANETLLVTGPPDLGLYTATITPPSGTALGNYTLRIRITYTGTLDPCGTTDYGEVEDYLIGIVPEVPCTWTGAVDNNWHNAGNWNTINIPDATTDITIPNVTNKCWVYGTTAFCNNITIEYGSGYDLRIWDQTLEVSGDMDFYGQLLMDHTDGIITAKGDVTWRSGSSASIQANAIMSVYGDWNFQSGANVTMNNGIVYFSGPGTSFISSFEENCYFNDLVIYKSGADCVSISSASTENLHIHGSLYIEPNCILHVYTPESVILQGDFVNLGEFCDVASTMVFNGSDQIIFETLAYPTTQYFNNLTISSALSTTISNKDIIIYGNLTIEEGQFISNDHNISIGGNWNNQVGPSGFDEGMGVVIINGGNYHQYCSDETFYSLWLNKPSGGAFRMQGTHVICEEYAWTAGAIDVVPGGGSFTAFDLFDDDIVGAYYLNAGGTINLYNLDFDMDLDGELHIFGGTMNIYGGMPLSYWPSTDDALISMSDGILDFHNQGIYINDASPHTLTENITGGVIRTVGSFYGTTNEFTPDYGTLEFYGSYDAHIETTNGCYLNNVLINKSTKDNSKINSKNKLNHLPLIDERSGKALGDGSKSNTLSLSGSLDINGNLVIDNGVLDTDGYNILIEGDWTNNVGDAGFIESTGDVFFNDNDNTGSTIHTNETFNDLTLYNASTGIIGLVLMDGIVVNVNNYLDLQYSTMEMNFASALNVGGDIFIAYGAGLNADDGDNVIEIGGDWTNENYPNSNYYGFWPGGETVIFNGSADQILNTNASQENFTNLVINKTGGNFRPDDNIQIFGELQIQDGNWWDNTTLLTHNFHGNLIIGADGNYYPQGTTVFKGIYDQTYQNDGGDAVFYDVVVDKTSTKDNISNNIEGQEKNYNPQKSSSPKAMSVTLLSDMDVYNLTTIEEGTLNLNGNNLKSNAPININDGGELLLDAGASLSIGFSLYVNNGGLFTASGASGNLADIGNDLAYKYDFEVKSGGSISANYANFNDIDMHGVEVKDGAYVDPANAFNNCNFYNGISSSFSALLIIENDQALNINNINFHNNPNYVDAYNIYKSGNQGEIVITTTGGDFTGPLYEYDDYDRIHWTDYVPGLWTGNVSSDWFDPDNWSDFNVPDATTNVVIPAGSPNYPVINNSTANCYTVTIEAGASLEVGNNELHVGYIFENYGEFIMTNGMAKLHSLNFYWHSGSTANVTAGEFHGGWWQWMDGTNASLGTGNTVYLDYAISQYDADASFGNLVLVSSKGDTGYSEKGLYPVRVSGDFSILNGASFQTSGDWIIDGNWVMEGGSYFRIWNGAQVLSNSSFTQDGELTIETISGVTVHGMFYFGASAILDIDDGTFICNYTLSSGWIDLLGDIQMTTGSLEFPGANISFAGTSSISGGTIIAGRSVRANPAGAFQPSGGILELTGPSGGHYLQIVNGNYVHDLFVNRSAPIGVHPGSPLLIQGNMEINSDFNAQGNTLTVNGDVGINGGGTLNVNDNAVLEMEDNRWIHVNNGGTIEVLGSPGNEANVTHTTGHYYFWVESGGTISADYAIFEYMRTDGIYIRPGAAVDPAYSFNNCTFMNGYNAGRLLTIYNDQDFTVENAVFPTNTWNGAYNVFKNSTPGNVTFINATGDFAGEAHEFDPYNLVHWGMPEVRLDLMVFLEGPFNGSSMNTDLNSIITLNHPFDPPLPYFGNPLPPDWYYTGGGSVGSIPGSTIVDWVLVQLRDATSPGTALPATEIGTAPAFVLNNGSVVNLDGSSLISFSVTPANNLYAVIWHRSHLGIISANPLVESGGIYSYDFSSAASQAYGGTSAQVQLSSSPVIWGMMAGDGDGSGDVSISDKNNVWSIQSGTAGYLESDYNLNKNVNNQDKNDYWIKNNGKATYIPE